MIRDYVLCWTMLAVETSSRTYRKEGLVSQWYGKSTKILSWPELIQRNRKRNLHVRKVTNECRFYGAEMCLALAFLHQNNILHRNIKLENILLAADGHIKLHSFTFAKEGVDKNRPTRSFCGTLEFLPPEV